MVDLADLLHPVSKIIYAGDWSASTLPFINEAPTFPERIHTNSSRAIRVDWESANIQERKANMDLEEGNDIVGCNFIAITYSDLRAMFTIIKQILADYVTAGGRYSKITFSEYGVEKQHGKWVADGTITYMV